MSDLAALDAITEAVESGAGLPEVVRAAARALDASLAVTDAWGATLAVAARSPAEERALLVAGRGRHEHRRCASPTRSSARCTCAPRREPSASMRRLLVTMIASEVERVRAPERASETAAADFLRAVLARELTEREELLARAKELSLDVEDGASMIVARAHPQAPTDEGWRGRVRAVAERGARAVASRSIAALSERDGVAGAEVLLLVPGGEEADGRARRRGGPARDGGRAVRLHVRARAQPHRRGPGRAAARGQRGAAGGERRRRARPTARRSRSSRPAPTACCCRAMSENPSELQRFYAETVEPLVAYDEQYETELVRTLETFLEADGNVAGTAQRLFTHRHTIYYRLERVRELSGLDVSSSDGREKLSLGLKSMRVLGISSAGGPASEAGAEGGRVPRRSGRAQRPSCAG